MTDTKNTVSDAILAHWVEVADIFGESTISSISAGELAAIVRELQSLRASIPGGVGVKEELLGLERYHQMTDGWGDEMIGLKQHPTGDYVKWSDILAICQSLSALDLLPAETAALPERCPHCDLHWGYNPPALIAGTDQVRCIECKTVYALSEALKENAP